MRIITDIFEFRQPTEVPNWNTISISGYHIREAGSTAAQELAFTIADGIAYVEAAVKAGLEVDEFASRLSFFFNVHNNFFEEIAKFRAARRLWARIMKDRFRRKDERSMMMRFHAQTAGSTLTAQQVDNNVVRVTLQALAAVLGGAQSLHTNSKDEALALPTENSALLALRTQQVIAHESDVTDTIDPLGGSYYIESADPRNRKESARVSGKIDDFGGAVAAIERGYMQREIQNAAFMYQREIETQGPHHRWRQRIYLRRRASRRYPQGESGDRGEAARAGRANPRGAQSGGGDEGARAGRGDRARRQRT